MNIYLTILRSINFVGLERTATRIARQMADRGTQGEKFHDAGWDFCLLETSLGYCNGEFGCYLPVLSSADRFHAKCRATQAVEDARIAAETEDDWQAYLASERERYEADMASWHAGDEAQRVADEAFLASRCKGPGPCYEEQVRDGYCQVHWDIYNHCFGCGELDDECTCGGEDDNDIYDINDHQDDDDDDLVPTGTVYRRALSHFGGNHELAREAAELYPGDFI